MENIKFKEQSKAAVLLIIGSLGVFFTSLSYLKCPPLLALPQLSTPPESYLKFATEQLIWLKIASNIGVFSDLFLFIACVFYAFKIDRNFLLQFSWIWLGLCSLIFFFVDAMLGHLLYPLVVDNNLPGLVISKYFFNLTFMLGVFCYFIGAFTYFLFKINNQKEHKIMNCLGIITAVSSGISFIAFLLGFYIPMVAGGSILVGSALFTIIGFLHLELNH
ncbi:MAG: hypothetical protein HOP07_05765 [Bacteriovoracaceae bacterium]|nr:hypothetical protein [Bacteriovoracaceae bacterium]